MDPEIRAYLDENRRHFDVLAERMGSQVQLVAESVSSLADRLDRLEQNIREEILRADSLRTAVPVQLENWKAIFRKPWIPA